MKICVVMFYDENIKNYGELNYKINNKYCKKYNLEIILSQTRKDNNRPQSWEKLLLLIENLSKFDYLIWIDADAFFYKDANNILDVIEKNPIVDFIFSGDIGDKNINCGFFIVKNTQYSMEFLTKWYHDEELYKLNPHPYWWEQGVLIYMFNHNILEIQQHSVSIPYGILQHFFQDKIKGVSYVYHLAGRDHNTRYITSKNYYDNVMNCYLFNENQSTPLCEIMGRNKSDKGDINIINSWHNYTTFYYSIFKDISDKNLRVFELGLGTNNLNIPSNMGVNGRPGASLYGWQEFFPNSYIFGADIDRDILFNTDKIKTFYCDQTNPEIVKKMWDEPLLQDNFDIIVDDGLHEFNANVCFFENSIHKLKSNGYFIIEDIHQENLFLNKIKEWESRYTDCCFTLLKIPSERNKMDNTLLVVLKSAEN